MARPTVVKPGGDVQKKSEYTAKLIVRSHKKLPIYDRIFMAHQFWWNQSTHQVFPWQIASKIWVLDPKFSIHQSSNLGVLLPSPARNPEVFWVLKVYGLQKTTNQIASQPYHPQVHHFNRDTPITHPLIDQQKSTKLYKTWIIPQ